MYKASFGFCNQIFFTLMGDWPSHNPQPGGPGVALGLASTPQPGQLVEPARGLSPNWYSSQGHRDTQAPPPTARWLACTDRPKFTVKPSHFIYKYCISEKNNLGSSYCTCIYMYLNLLNNSTSAGKMGGFQTQW